MRASILPSVRNTETNFYGLSLSLQSKRPSVLKEFADAQDAFGQLLTQTVDPEKPVVEATAFDAAGQKAREASFKLWASSANPA